MVLSCKGVGKKRSFTIGLIRFIDISYISVLFIETIPYVLAYLFYELFFYLNFTQPYAYIHQNEISKKNMLIL